MFFRTYIIALNTFREAIRQKVLYGLVVFTLALIGLSMFLSQLSLGAETKMIKDLGLAAIMFLGAMISIFMGVGLLYKEVERKTIYTLLSKPILRGEFVVGKFFGLAMTLALEVACMSMAMFVVLCFYQETIDWALLKAVYLIFLELCVLIAASLMFASNSSSFMSIIFSVSFLMIGHAMPSFIQVLRKAIGEGLILDFFNLFNLNYFVANTLVVHGVPVPWSMLYHATGYAIGVCTFLLMGGVYLFSRRDFE